MITRESIVKRSFEHTDVALPDEKLALSPERVAAISLSLARTCMRYASIERVPRYHEAHRENDAEHSLMVSMIATELAAQFRPDLDIGLVAQFSNVHDLVETATLRGDVATYLLDDRQLAAKHDEEQDALAVLLPTLPPYTRQLVIEYESQKSKEARFVRAVDKLTPLLVDILGPGKQVLAQDYGVTSLTEVLLNQKRLNDSMVRRFGEDTPEIVEAYILLGEIFATQYDATEIIEQG